MDQKQREEIMNIIRSGNPEYVPAPNYVKPSPEVLLARLKKRDKDLIAQGQKPIWLSLFHKIQGSQ